MGVCYVNYLSITTEDYLLAKVEILPPGPIPSRFRDRDLFDQGQDLGPPDQALSRPAGDGAALQNDNAWDERLT